MVRVKWRPDLGIWVFDWDGVSELEARRHGFRGLPRPARVHTLLDDAADERRHEARMAKLTDKEAAKIAEKAARQAAARDWRRARSKIYFAAYYTRNRERIAARRKAQRQASRPPASIT
jgi:hypothetical protein